MARNSATVPRGPSRQAMKPSRNRAAKPARQKITVQGSRPPSSRPKTPPELQTMAEARTSPAPRLARPGRGGIGEARASGKGGDPGERPDGPGDPGPRSLGAADEVGQAPQAGARGLASRSAGGGAGAGDPGRGRHQPAERPESGGELRRRQRHEIGEPRDPGPLQRPDEAGAGTGQQPEIAGRGSGGFGSRQARQDRAAGAGAAGRARNRTSPAAGRRASPPRSPPGCRSAPAGSSPAPPRHRRRRIQIGSAGQSAVPKAARHRPGSGLAAAGGRAARRAARAGGCGARSAAPACAGPFRRGFRAGTGSRRAAGGDARRSGAAWQTSAEQRHARCAAGFRNAGFLSLDPGQELGERQPERLVEAAAAAAARPSRTWLPLVASPPAEASRSSRSSPGGEALGQRGEPGERAQPAALPPSPRGRRLVSRATSVA